MNVLNALEGLLCLHTGPLSSVVVVLHRLYVDIKDSQQEILRRCIDIDSTDCPADLNVTVRWSNFPSVYRKQVSRLCTDAQGALHGTPPSQRLSSRDSPRQPPQPTRPNL